MKFSPPGPGLAITRAPATCMPPPKWWLHEMGGKFPATAEGLRALPGVGSYTSGAIAAIAYDEKQAAMDANAERVIARLFAIQTPMPRAKTATARAVFGAGAGPRWGFRTGTDGSGSDRSAHPSGPPAGIAPGVRTARRGKRSIQEDLPVKAPKIARPLKRGAAFVVRDRTGAVLLVKRPDKGLACVHAGATAGTLDREISVTGQGADPGAVRGKVEKTPRYCAPWLHAF